MNELVSIAEAVESAIGRKLEIISGGATSSYPLVLEGAMPPRINHLRIGEGILLAYDLKEIWGLDMSGMRQDVFTLKAEVVEVREKPSHPVGEIFIDCFGRKPEYEDRGIRKRAILAMGKLDFALETTRYSPGSTESRSSEAAATTAFSISKTAVRISSSEIYWNST